MWDLLYIFVYIRCSLKQTRLDGCVYIYNPAWYFDTFNWYIQLPVLIETITLKRLQQNAKHMGYIYNINNGTLSSTGFISKQKIEVNLSKYWSYSYKHMIESYWSNIMIKKVFYLICTIPSNQTWHLKQNTRQIHMCLYFSRFFKYFNH